jgi:hypothetical protein
MEMLMAKMKATSLTPAPVSAVNEPATFSLGPPVRPSFDLIEILPAGAANRLRMLRQRSADAHALIPDFETVREANTARLLADQRLQRLQASAHDGGFNLPETDSRVIAEKKQVAKLTDDARRVTERGELRAKAWREAGAALQNVENWLSFGKPHGVTLQDFEAEPVKLAKSEKGLLDAILNRRRRVRELRADAARIAAAPYPSSYCKQRMREMVEQLSQRAVDVSMLVEHDDKIIWPTMRLQSTVFNAAPGAVAFAEGVRDTLALLAFLLKPTLIAALDIEIDNESSDAEALSHEERQLRIAEVEGDLLAVERDESALVWRAMDERLPIEHRSDVSPVALLGLRLITAAPVNGSRGTSPEHMMITFAGAPR